jgi:hypothetical protein
MTTRHLASFLIAASSMLTPMDAGAEPAKPAAPDPVVEAPARLFVRDGQLVSHPFTVFVTHQVDASMQPVLRLTGAHLVTETSSLEQVELRPKLVAPHQTRTIQLAGAEVQADGTLLIFDLAPHKVAPYKSAVRLLPVLEWSVAAAGPGQEAVKRQVVSESDIYLGNMLGATLWTLVTVLFVLALLVAWSYSKSNQVTAFKARPALLLITGPDGYLSLWRTQLALWTIAVGSLVFLFGLVRLKVPEIPDTLVALMGMSLLTGVFAKKGQVSGPEQEHPAPAVSPKAAAPQVERHGPQLADLIASWNQEAGQLEFSLPKAQMVFWTVIVLALFCVKSVLGGELWPVPWQLVALTGFSQAGYVGDKFVKAKP